MARQNEIYPLVIAIEKALKEGKEKRAKELMEIVYTIQDGIDAGWREKIVKPVDRVVAGYSESAQCYVYPSHPAIRTVSGYYETLCCQFAECYSWYEKYHQQLHAYCGSNMLEKYYYDKRVVPGWRLVQWGEYCSNCGYAYGPFYRWYVG